MSFDPQSILESGEGSQPTAPDQTAEAAVRDEGEEAEKQTGTDATGETRTSAEEGEMAAEGEAAEADQKPEIAAESRGLSGGVPQMAHNLYLLRRLAFFLILFMYLVTTLVCIFS